MKTPPNRFYLRGIMILFCAIGITATLKAQSSVPDTGDLVLSQHREEVRLLLQQQAEKIAAKPTGMKQRVIAQRRKSFLMNDSATYAYSGTRGSRFGYDLFRFNYYLTDAYSPQALNTYTLADRVNYYQDDVFQWTDYGYYRSGNKIDSIATNFDGTIYNPDRGRIIYTYSVPEFPASRNSLQYNSGSPTDTGTITNYFYSNSELVSDTTLAKVGGVWTNQAANHYNYGIGGKLSEKRSYTIVGSIAELSSTSSYSYYPDEKLKRVYTLRYSAGMPTDTLIDSTAYTPGINYATYWETRRYKNSTSTYQSSFTEIWYPGSGGAPDSAFTAIGFSNSSQIETRYFYIINSFSNPERITIFEEGNTSPNPDQTINFYYEIYDDGLAINKLPDDGGFKVYPNPFTNQISVDCQNQNNGAISVRLLNVIGQQVFETTLQSALITQTINVPNLSDGYYIMLLQNEKGEIRSKKMIKE